MCHSRTSEKRARIGRGKTKEAQGTGNNPNPKNGWVFVLGRRALGRTSRRGATRWTREVSRHVLVLHGNATRAGGDVELFHRRYRYAFHAPFPPFAETMPIRGFFTGLSIAARARASRGVHLPQTTPAVLSANASHRTTRATLARTRKLHRSNRVASLFPA